MGLSLPALTRVAVLMNPAPVTEVLRLARVAIPVMVTTQAVVIPLAVTPVMSTNLLNS